MITNNEMHSKCLQIEDVVRTMVLSGKDNLKDLVDAVDDVYHPQNQFEMEMYSEAIIYAKYGVLN